MGKWTETNFFLSYLRLLGPSKTCESLPFLLPPSSLMSFSLRDPDLTLIRPNFSLFLRPFFSFPCSTLCSPAFQALSCPFLLPLPSLLLIHIILCCLLQIIQTDHTAFVSIPNGSSTKKTRVLFIRFLCYFSFCCPFCLYLLSLVP
jgi:hypothetical protein